MKKEVEFLVKANATQATNEFAKTDRAMQNTAKSADVMARSMNSARYVGLSFNRVIQDAPFFLQSVQMGILAVSNNVQQLGDAWGIHRAKFTSSAAAIKAFLPTLISVPNLISLAVSAVLAYSLASRGAKDDTDKLSGSWVTAATDVTKYKTAVQQATEATKSFTLAQLKAFEVETSSKYRAALAERVEMQTKLNRLQETIRTAPEAGARVGGGLNIGQAQLQIDSLTKQIEDSLKVSNEYADVIKETQERIKVYGLTESSINAIIKQKKEELSNLVIGSKEYIEVQKEINALEKQIPKKGGGVKDQFANSVQTAKEFFKQVKEIQSRMASLPKDGAEWFQYNELLNNVLQKRIDLYTKMENIAPTAPFLTPESILSTLPKSEIDTSYMDYLMNLEIDQTLADAKENFGKFTQLGTAAASVIGNSFTRMWENVFGEANSLFEQLVKTMVSTAAGLATQGLFSGLVSALVPGGSFIGGFLGSLGLSTRPSMPTSININIAGEDFQTVLKSSSSNILRYESL